MCANCKHFWSKNTPVLCSPLIWIWPTEKKMNTRHYTFQLVIEHKKSKRKRPKGKNLNKSLKYEYFSKNNGCMLCVVHKTTIYVEKCPYFKHFSNLFLPDFLLFGYFWLFLILMHYLHTGMCSFSCSFSFQWAIF